MDAGLNFEADPLIGKIFDSYSEECIALAGSFGIALDRSEASVAQIEKIASVFHNQMPAGGVPEARLVKLQKVLGSHLAQVLIGSRHGVAGVVHIGDSQVPAVCMPSGEVCWPWAQLRRRILEGASENVWQHYCNVVASSQARTGEPDPVVPTHQSTAPV